MASDTVIQKREHRTTEPEQTRGGRAYSPDVDILEKDNELLLLADVPGATADQIDVNYEQGLLTIHAKVPPRQDPDKTHYLLREYGVGDYYRSFRIGEGIDAASIQAELSQGVLTVRLPKAAEVRPRKIAVRSA